MLSKRLIACLDVRNGCVVKGVQFEGLRNAGDPAALARRYNVEGIESGTQAYFTHSYAADLTPEAVAVTTHAAPFASVVETDQVFGVQFHPEKSAAAGVQMLRNFVALCSRSA